MYNYIAAEILKRQWMILPASLRAMLSVLDGDKLSADDYKKFHAVQKDIKLKAFSQFGSAVDDTHYSYRRNNVGVLVVDGPIIPRATWFSNMSGMVSLDQLEAEMRAFEEDTTIDHIVGVFDTPGGAVTGLADFTDALKSLQTPTTAYTLGMMASAGYFIGSGFNQIVSAADGLVGSIGTVLTLQDDTEAMKKRGLASVEIVSSQSPNKRPDLAQPEGRAVLQTLVDDLADVFVDTVARNRAVNREDVLENYGQGAMLIASKAVDVGMIDSVSTLEKLITSVEKIPQKSGFKKRLTSVGSTAEDNMSKENDLTADERQAEIDAAVKKAQQQAVAAERNRLTEIDALAAKFANDTPSVVKAVNEHIAKAKQDPEATAGSVAVELIDVAQAARTVAVGNYAKNKVEGGQLLNTVTKADDVDPKTASEQRVSRLTSAMDRLGTKEVH